MAKRRCSELCGILGFKKFELRPNGEKLEQRLKVPTEKNGNEPEEHNSKAITGNSKEKKKDKKIIERWQ